jgi:hypothetical protein
MPSSESPPSSSSGLSNILDFFGTSARANLALHITRESNALRSDHYGLRPLLCTEVSGLRQTVCLDGFVPLSSDVRQPPRCPRTHRFDASVCSRRKKESLVSVIASIAVCGCL